MTSNLAIYGYKCVGGARTPLAPLPLIGPIRRRVPRLHGLLGYLVVVLELTTAVGGFVYIVRRGGIQNWLRPPIPEFNDLLNILGVEIHDLLSGKSTVSQASSSSQNRVGAIMRANGRY